MRLPKWLRRTDPTQGERIDPTAPECPLDAQDVAAILSILEEEVDKEPYLARAIHLSALMDKLDDWMLEQ